MQSLRAALADRLLLSEALKIVGRILDCYPSRPQSGDSYQGALASVLMAYPRIVAEQSCDMLKGVARETRFLPTVADLVVWCERGTDELRRPVTRDDRERQLKAEAKARKTVETKLAADRAARPTLQQMRDKHGPNWGLQAADSEKQIAEHSRRALLTEANQRALQAEYEATGIAPMEAAPGIPVSPSLLRQLQARPAPMREDQAERVAG